MTVPAVRDVMALQCRHWKATAERCVGECNTDERRDGKLHRRSCSKYSYADEESAIDRCCAADQLESLQEEPAWKPVPEKLVAAYETAYQRYLALGR